MLDTDINSNRVTSMTKSVATLSIISFLALSWAVTNPLIKTVEAADTAKASKTDEPAGNNHIERSYYNPWEREIGYAPVVKVGNTLYLSGVTSPGKDMAAQVEAVYKTIGSLLKAHGADYQHIVKETVFTKDIEALKSTSAIRKQFFADGEDPASSWIQIDRLFMEEYLIEVEVMAVLPPN